MSSYLTSRHEKTKIGENFSYWNKIITEVPPGMNLGRLLFNISVNNWR